MPYINIKITREGATAAQKAELIRGTTESQSKPGGAHDTKLVD